MPPTTESARLRVVGQELEQRGVFDFDVMVEQDGYHVRGYPVPEAPKPPSAKPRWTIGTMFRSTASAIVPGIEPETWEKTYTRADIERLDGWYKARRQKSGAPDDYAVSQVLRVIGAYTEQHQWKLTSVSRKGQMVAIGHEDARGRMQTSEQNYSELYDFSYHMFKARKVGVESN
jgi:hypothetical protein